MLKVCTNYTPFHVFQESLQYSKFSFAFITHLFKVQANQPMQEVELQGLMYQPGDNLKIELYSIPEVPQVWMTAINSAVTVNLKSNLSQLR